MTAIGQNGRWRQNSPSLLDLPQFLPSDHQLRTRAAHLCVDLSDLCMQPSNWKLASNKLDSAANETGHIPGANSQSPPKARLSG